MFLVSGGRDASLGCSRVIRTAASNIGCHFQGTSYSPPDPGLKPWAVLYSRFAARYIAREWDDGTLFSKSTLAFDSEHILSITNLN
jgi:hypothetical protein